MPCCSSLVRLLAVLLPSALVTASLGCAEPNEPLSDEEEAIGIYGQPIKGGYMDAEDTAVVGIYDAASGGQCTGSLIAPNVVLTARHCVSNTPEAIQCGQAKPGGLHSAKYFYVTTRTDLYSNKASDYHKVREVIGLPLDPSSPDPLLNKEDLCGRDVAILILEDNVAPSEAVPYTPRVDSSLVKDEQYYAVGFGATSDSGSGAGVRRRRDNLFVDCVAEACPSFYVKKTEFIGDTGICQGDSGGPAIDMQHRVVGVTSRGSWGCDSPVYGHVFGWGQWIKDVTNYAAGLGGYAPPPWASGKSTDPAYNAPVGAPCDAACISGICVTPEGYCSSKCDDLNPCPDDYECNPDLVVCTKKPAPVDEEPKDKPKKATKKGDDANNAAAVSCAVSAPDPTKPIPWKTGAILVGAVGALALRRRRRG